MNGTGDQIAYWNTTGATKTFTHPVEFAWLKGVDPAARILDYGCGYGRVCAAIADKGFLNLTGVDPSPALIGRARRFRPDLHFEVLDPPPKLPARLGRFDVVLLIAVLTCVLENDAQQHLIAEVIEAMAPGGLLYLSDLLLQDDERYRDRYAARARVGGLPYGVFATTDGALCRHHELDHLRSLLVPLAVTEQRIVDVATMNGNKARAVQMLLRKP